MEQNQRNRVESHRDHFETYENQGPDQEVYDDGMVHVTRQGVRFVFDAGEVNYVPLLGPRDVRTYAEFVDSVLNDEGE